MKYASQYDEARYTKQSAQIRNKITQSTHFTKQMDVRSSRINSSTTTNIKGKLNLFQLVLNKLQDQTNALLNQTNESSKYLENLKRDLVDIRLSNSNNNCIREIKKFEKFMEQGINAETNHVQAIKEKCDILIEEKQSIKNNFFQLKKRIQRIQNTMGYYIGHQKHRS